METGLKPNNSLGFLIKLRHAIPLLLLALWLTSCQLTPPPPPITASVSDEFILASGQSAVIAGTDLTLKLIAVPGDERCPIEIECAASGPVTLSVSIQKGESEPADFILQSFTDSNGRAPEGPFEGIQDRMEYEGYLIQVKGVLPYPVQSMGEVKDSEYQVSFVITAR
ncbi:MAG: hypothetical protein IH589_15535 [Anaerolineales bacterium]|nr:hypothetical protein [Anaerolineales bacterium]